MNEKPKLRRDRFYNEGVHNVARMFPSNSQVQVVKELRFALDEYESNSRKGVYDPTTGELVEKLLMGEIIKTERSQKRRIKTKFPLRGRGRPQKLETDVLLSTLAVIWVRWMETAPTFDGGGVNARGETKTTPFEKFVGPVFEALGLSGVKPSIRKHLQSKARQEIK
jgi:hypothetical protein